MLLDIILQPFIIKTKSYIRDIGNFLSKVQDLELTSDDWMFSMDVTSLYTNIQHSDGIECMKKVLEQCVNSTPKNSSIIKLLEFVLKSNNFMFNQDNYLQIMAQPWVQELPQHMPICSWILWNRNTYTHILNVLEFGSGS